MLDVLALDEGGEERAVGGGEVARRRLEQECRRDESGEREPSGEAGRRDRDKHRGSDEVGADEHPLPVPAVGGDAAVEAERERRHAVCEPHRDDAERASRDEREPHERDVVQRVAELAGGDGDEEAAEVAAVAEQVECPPRRCLRLEQLFRDGSDRVGHGRSLPEGRS